MNGYLSWTLALVNIVLLIYMISVYNSCEKIVPVIPTISNFTDSSPAKPKLNGNDFDELYLTSKVSLREASPLKGNPSHYDSKSGGFSYLGGKNRLKVGTQSYYYNIALKVTIYHS
jgi:hypothetical protein